MPIQCPRCGGSLVWEFDGDYHYDLKCLCCGRVFKVQEKNKDTDEEWFRRGTY